MEGTLPNVGATPLYPAGHPSALDFTSNDDHDLKTCIFWLFKIVFYISHVLIDLISLSLKYGNDGFH